MARGSSQSQASATAGSGARPTMAGPRGTPAAAAAGMRRRRVAGGAAGFGGGGAGGGSNMLRFYTDDAPGLKMSPTVVLVMSLCFIGFVTALHVFGKIYRYRSAASGGGAS
ncbi:Protein transport protein Sec61 subunit beta [Ananas comosus]|uniref:Protein transport protein Sec61 subunit beta n=2 Tax=Ananas comosus TaxID=4615 RepID=A0A199W2H6_ANACO|nr:Protein transport protein Sec61 subunit beta [Ananas comosus]